MKNDKTRNFFESSVNRAFEQVSESFIQIIKDSEIDLGRERTEYIRNTHDLSILKNKEAYTNFFISQFSDYTNLNTDYTTFFITNTLLLHLILLSKISDNERVILLRALLFQNMDYVKLKFQMHRHYRSNFSYEIRRRYIYENLDEFKALLGSSIVFTLFKFKELVIEATNQNKILEFSYTQFIVYITGEVLKHIQKERKEYRHKDSNADDNLETLVDQDSYIDRSSISIYAASFLKDYRGKPSTYRLLLFRYHYICKHNKEKKIDDIFDCIRKNHKKFADVKTTTLRPQITQNRKYLMCYLHALQYSKVTEPLDVVSQNLSPMPSGSIKYCSEWEEYGDALISLISPRDLSIDNKDSESVLTNKQQEETISERVEKLTKLDLEKERAKVKLKLRSRDESSIQLINNNISWFRKHVFPQLDRIYSK